MQKIIKSLFFAAILNSACAYAENAKLIMEVSCIVTHASTVGFSPAPVVHKYCTANSPEPDSKNRIGEYAVSCPEGFKATVSYRLNVYDEKTGKICPVNPQDPDAPDIYQDPQCREIWEPNTPINYAFCKEQLCYHKALFCQSKTPAGKDKKYYVVELEINY